MSQMAAQATQRQLVEFVEIAPVFSLATLNVTPTSQLNAPLK
jgi:hypothetical protein